MFIFVGYSLCVGYFVGNLYIIGIVIGLCVYMLQMNSLQLRDFKPTHQELEKIQASRRELYLLLDDITDTYNIGCFFRLADALGVKKIWLCGITECPPNPRIEKSSVGTYKIVAWEYAKSSREQIVLCKQQIPNLNVVAVEQSIRSVDITQMQKNLPLLLVLGHESRGVSTETLEVCDQIVELPMFGVNKSMNVLVTASMVLGVREYCS